MSEVTKLAKEYHIVDIGYKPGYFDGLVRELFGRDTVVKPVPVREDVGLKDKILPHYTGTLNQG